MSKNLRVSPVLTRCNITNNNLHNYSARSFIASFVLFGQTNPRQLFNKLAIYRIITHWMYVCMCVCVYLCVCVCVCVCSTVKAFSVCKMFETYFRGTDQRSCVVNINLGASAKFLHIRI